MTKNLFKDLIKYIPSLVIPAIVGLISIPIVTRLFLPADYGNYTLVLSTVTILTTIVGWLSMSIVRFYPAYEKDKKLDVFYSTVLKWLFISIFGISVLALTILLVGKSHIQGDLYNLILIGIGVFICLSFSQTLLAFLRAKRSINLYAGFSIWKSVLAIGFGLILVIIFKFGIEGLLWGTILSIALILPWLWKKTINKFSLRKKTSRPLVIEMAKFGFPLVMGNLAYWVLTLSDRYILKFFRGAQEVGIYSASYAIGEKSILFFVSLFTLSAIPLAIRIWEKEGEEKSRIFNTNLTRYFLLICLPVVVGISILAKPILNILTGQKYFMGYTILPFLALSIFLNGSTMGFGNALGYYKKTKYIMWSLIIGGSVNLGLNFIFIPKYGYFAAAITTLIGYIVMVGLEIYFSRKFFIWKFPFKSMYKIICASGIMGIAIYYLNNITNFSNFISLILGICTGATIYFFILFLFNEFRVKEINEIRLLASKIFQNFRLK